MNRPEWGGRTVVCLASGPSLTAEDCELVRQSGHPTIVTNTTFRLAPWADVLFAMDMMWWKEHQREVKSVFAGRKLSTSHAARAYGAESLWACRWLIAPSNSGQGAIHLAMAGGAAKIVLLGFDCQETGGKKHWHGDHPKGLGNGASLKRWPKHFDRTKKEAGKAGVDVLNATRQTALTSFPLVKLEDVL